MANKTNKVVAAEPKKLAKTSSTKKALSINVFGIDGQKKPNLTVPEELFSVSASDRLLAQYVRVYSTNQRQGTRKVKSRGEVNISTRKIYRQKGTGRARHGAKSAPIFVGGGVAHGPTQREYMLKLNKKQKRKALLGSLSRTVKDNTVFVLDGAQSLGKTKDLLQTFNTILDNKTNRVLLVYASAQEKGLYASAQNIENIEAVDARIINAHDVLKARHIAFTNEAMKDFIRFRTKNK